MKQIATLLFFMLINTLGLMAQSVKSLEEKLNQSSLTSTQRIDIMNNLSRELCFVDYAKSLYYAQEALANSTEYGYLTGIAYSYRNLGNVHCFNESYFAGIEFLQRAIDLFKNEGDSAGIANCYISLGYTYRQLADKNQELEYNRKSFEIFKRLGSPERIGVTSHNLGESYYNIGNYEKSEELTLLAIHINDSIQKLTVLSSCYKVMGLIHLKKGNLDIAERNFEKVLKIGRKLGENSQKVATIIAYMQLSSIYKHQQNTEKELQYLTQAIEFGKTHNLRTYLKELYLTLSIYYTESYQPEKTRSTMALYKEVTEALKIQELKDRARLVNNIEEVHKLAQANISLENTNSIQTQTIESKNSLLLVIVPSTILLLFLLIKFLSTNNKLNQQNKLVSLQKEELEKLNQTKDKFFNIVAHDLKTPLNSLKSFSILLNQHYDNLGKDEILNMSHLLSVSVDNTIKMADNLITWAKIQMNDISYNPKIFKIDGILTDIDDVYQSIAQDKNISLSSSSDEGLLVYGDKNQVKFIIRNLVNNAVKFTRSGGKVEVTAHALPNQKVQILVKDNGVGMSTDMKQDLFAIGSKTSNNGTAGETGTGLGLMLCYEFVKANDGEIRIESEEKKGTTFFVTLNNIKTA